MLRRRVPLALALTTLVACSSGAESSSDDPLADATDDVVPDAASDDAVDARADVAVDARPDASDAGDARPDTGAASDAKPVDPPVPTAVANCMRAAPYVEESCSPITIKRWPHPAKRCKYGSPIGTLTVDVADATADRVAIWILSAAREVPWVAKLEKSEPARFLEVMKIMAVDVMYQSGRIFPLKGIIGEDMTGTKYIGYPFTDGVADGCPTGEPHCYCRINSLTRGMLCDYRAAMKLEGLAACKARVGYGQGNTPGWYAECVDNHEASWGAPQNEHFDAKLWALLNGAGITASASGAQVVAALYSQLGMKPTDVTAFCK